MKLKNLLMNGVLAGALAFGNGCKPVSVDNGAEKLRNTNNRDNLGEVVLNYLSQPGFANTNLMKQVTGVNAQLRLYDVGQGKAYFSITQNDYNTNTLDRFVINSEEVEFGKDVNGKFTGSAVKLGDYSLRLPNTYFFRIPADKFKVNPNAKAEVNFENINYDLSMQELSDYLQNKSIYGGKLNFISETNSQGKLGIMANHGAFVAKAGEPSLTRLVDRLTKKEDSREVKAQKLLDFVSKQIEYNFREANANVETLKRPNEVLMSGNSDCSGKAILLSSLFENAGLKNRLIYTPNHISVAVEGNYPNQNDLAFDVNNERYSVAEPTAVGFKIGKDKVKTLSFNSITQMQKPGTNSVVFDFKSGKQLPFY